jgi:hypothetical protein
MPLKLAVGVKVRVASAVLISGTVALNVIVASLVPSPTVKTRVVVLVGARLKTPFIAVSATWIGWFTASGSETENVLGAVKASVASSATVCGIGTAFTGGSFAGPTVICTCAVAVRPPGSRIVYENESGPLYPAFGV